LSICGLFFNHVLARPAFISAEQNQQNFAINQRLASSIDKHLIRSERGERKKRFRQIAINFFFS